MYYHAGRVFGVYSLTKVVLLFEPVLFRQVKKKDPFLPNHYIMIPAFYWYAPEQRLIV
jgi:hypothetical protein